MRAFEVPLLILIKVLQTSHPLLDGQRQRVIKLLHGEYIDLEIYGQLATIIKIGHRLELEDHTNTLKQDPDFLNSING